MLKPSVVSRFPTIVLVLISVIWGVGIVTQRIAGAHIGSGTFNAARFFLATIVLLVLTNRWRRTPEILSLSLRAPIFSILMFVGADVQQRGFELTTASRGGFITGLYIVIIPLLHSSVFREHSSGYHWSGALVAVTGLGFLSGLLGFVNTTTDLNFGDALVFISAIVFAIQFVMNEKIGVRFDPIDLSIAQNAGCCVLAFITALLTESTSIESFSAAVPAIAYSSLLSISLGYTLQMWVQHHLPAGQVALILSLESVVAAVAGWLILGELLTVTQIFGATLMIAGITVAQIPVLRSQPNRTEDNPRPL